MKKFKFLVAFGIKKRVYKKAFIISNLIIGLFIIGIVNLPNIIEMFSSEDEVQVVDVVIINDTNDPSFPLEDNVIQTLNQLYDGYTFEESDSTADESTFWDQQEVDVYINFTGDLKEPNVEIYALDGSLEYMLTQSIQLVLYDYQDIGYATYDIKTPPSNGEDPGLSEEDQSFLDGIGGLLFLPIFFLIMLGTQFIGVDIVEEKSSKAIEMIISSVPAKTHFLSKIISNVSFLLIQSGVLLVFGYIATLVSKLFESTSEESTLNLFAELGNLLPNWPSILLLAGLFLIFGSLLYLVLASFLAAISSSQEDFQQFYAPMVILILGGYYLTIFLPLLGATTVIRVFAFIPFFSTMVAPMAYVRETITLFEGLISLFLTIGTLALFIYFIAPIYRVAILSYDQTKFFSRIKFYVKKAFHKK